MRSSYNDFGFVVDEKSGELLGISLGYDHCAEHEWGIKELMNSFGLPEDPKIFGVEKRAITKSGEPDLQYFKGIIKDKKRHDILIFSDSYSWMDNEKEKEKSVRDNAKSSVPWYYLNDEKREEEDRIGCAWDQKSFAIVAQSPENKKRLGEIYEAFLDKDIILGLNGSSNPFAGEGLTFMIKSRFPQEAATRVYEVDKAQYELKEDFRKSGIENKIIKAFKKSKSSYHPFFALSPRRLDKEGMKKHNTKYPFWCWLNPSDQQNNNSGMFTVEQLELWIKGEGPIPMTEKQKEKRRG